MREVTIKAYQYDELSDKAKEKAREWFAGGIDGSDYDAVTEDAKAILAVAGFDGVEVFWSGFGSAGDGASFKGTWRASDFDTDWRRMVGESDRGYFPLLIRLEEFAKQWPEFSAAVRCVGRYSHSRTMHVETGEYADQSNESMQFCDWCREWANAIYRKLSAENDYLYSTENMEEGIRANEYAFREDGRRFPEGDQ